MTGLPCSGLPRVAAGLCAAVALLLASATAGAQTDLRVVAAEGVVKVAVAEGAQADAAAINGAKDRARDQAFANAVDTIVDALVAPSARRPAAREIRERVVGRARLFVAKFRTRSQALEGENYRVAIDAWIDAGKVQQALAEIGVDLAASALPPDQASPTTSDSRPSVALLVRADIAGTVAASFGRVGIDGGELGRTVARGLREQGFVVAPTGGLEVTLAEEPVGPLPLSDRAAAELAGRAGAGIAVLVAADIGDDGKIRGTGMRGARGRGLVRVVDVRDGRVVTEIEVTSAGYGADELAAASDAAAELGTRAAGLISAPMVATWPAPVPREGGVLVEVRGVTEWAVVAELERVLSRAPGVRGVATRTFRRRFVALVADTDMSPKRLQKALVNARFGTARVNVTAGDDDVIRVDVVDAVPSSERNLGSGGR